MCTELVPILHTRENFVPDLHMCDEYLTNSTHIRSYIYMKFEHKMQNTSFAGLLGEESNIDVF